MLADYHVHTEFSDDSVYPLEQVIQDAMKKKIDELCITDHVDYGVKFDCHCGKPITGRDKTASANVDYPRYIDKITEMRHLYRDQIKLKTGMEFGIQVHTIAQYEALFDTYDFDFVILSVHQAADQEFWNQEFQKGRSQKEYNERYYEELLNVVKQYKDYSVLGHLDLIVRYDHAGVYPFEKIKPIVTDILKVVIADGKGIELNTSYHRYGLSDSMPSVEILKLYRELGGRIITIGSDSHQPEHLGAYLAEAKALLSSLGFRSFCTYDKMRPIYHDLDTGGGL